MFSGMLTKAYQLPANNTEQERKSSNHWKYFFYLFRLVFLILLFIPLRKKKILKENVFKILC